MQEVEMDLIRKMAWGFVRDDLELDELIGEASLAYAKALTTYKPDAMTKLTTWCWSCMKNHLIDFTTKTRRSKMGVGSYESNNPEPVNEINTEDKMIFLEELFNMGPQIKEMCEMILEHPEDFMTPDRSQTRIKLTNRLRGMGWNWTTIKKTYKQVSMALQY